MDDKRAIEALKQLEAIPYREPVTLTMEMVETAFLEVAELWNQMLQKHTEEFPGPTKMNPQTMWSDFKTRLRQQMEQGGANGA